MKPFNKVLQQKSLHSQQSRLLADSVEDDVSNAGKEMALIFTEEERDYIVNNHETDLVLTEVGISLIERFTRTDTGISINATDADIADFFAELREEYRCKINRISSPYILTGLARRLLSDFEAIEIEEYC